MVKCERHIIYYSVQKPPLSNNHSDVSAWWLEMLTINSIADFENNFWIRSNAIDRCRDSIKIIIVPTIIVQRLGTINKKKLYLS